MNAPIRNTFSKQERLCSKKVLHAVFSSRRLIHAKPLRAHYVFTPLTEPVVLQVAFSVPKRNVKKAHNRNTVKRRMREAWRINKHELTDALKIHGKQLAVVIVWNSTEIPDFQEVREKIILILERLIQEAVAGSR